MNEIAFQSATALASAIRSRTLSSRELLEHYIRRVECFNPQLNAVVTLDCARARECADRADAAIARGESWGPLHGVPMTVKDCFETEGMRTTAGALSHAGHVPASSATSVRRLADAGAVIFGKTNVPAFAMDVQTYNPIFGTANNPWDLSRSPGGSSGGAAAALAAGLTALELGSDIGGSIRLPAHFCGIYGHKPTHGLVSMRGHIPGPPGSLTEIDIAVAGPMARSPDDLALMLDILAAPDSERAIAWQLRLPPPRHIALGEYRIAAWFDDANCPIDRELRKRYQLVVEALRGEGAKVDEHARPEFRFSRASRIYADLLLAASASGVPAEQFHQLAQKANHLAPDDESLAAQFIRGTTLRHRDWGLINEARLQLRATWSNFFRHYDVLLCPVTPTAAIAHDHSEPLRARTIEVNERPQSYMTQMSWTGIVGAAYLPATVAPVGRTATGLPVGVQIVVPCFEDHTAIAFSRLLAGIVGGFEVPPGY